MRIFDRIDPLMLERRNAQLWILALAMILVLAGGIALLMYPGVFSTPLVIPGRSMRHFFYSFCVLSLLLFGYLLERHLVVERLRRRLEEERTRASRVLGQASTDLLNSLPRYGHFQDRLVMEFRRAASLRQPLSLIIAALRLSQELEGREEASVAVGDAAKAILRRLRREDSIYLFSADTFGIVLPGASGADAHRVGERLAEGLTDASGAGNRFAFELRVANYPEEAATAWEMQQVAAAYAPRSAREAAAV